MKGKFFSGLYLLGAHFNFSCVEQSYTDASCLGMTGGWIYAEQ